MKITAIRIRKLVSRNVGYGHDAAEIEARLDEDDNPDVVAAELHRRVDTEIRQGAERQRLGETVTELYETVARLEREKERMEKQIKANRAEIAKHKELVAIADRAGIRLDGDLFDLLIPF